MPIHEIHAFLVHPNKLSEADQDINGQSVPLHGGLGDLLRTIYERADEECNIDITFSPAEDGTKQNDCRDLILQYVSSPTLEAGRRIAKRLGQNTDGRSALGLLFLIVGSEGAETKVVISRFPTDYAIYVDEDAAAFTLQFLERVFMKNRESYKAVIYRHESLIAGFWQGRAVDKQLNRQAGHVSNYWIVDFLASRLTSTPAAGTRRLAAALREALKSVDVHLKQEISAAATLAQGLEGETLSIREFGERYRLSQGAREAIVEKVRSRQAAEEQFEFDVVEFQRAIAFRSVELSNGAVLTAGASDFDEVFHREAVDDEADGYTRFVTEGRIVDEKLRARG